MKIMRIGEHSLPLPKRATDGAAGYDLQSAEDEIILPGNRAMIHTGFAWQIPLAMVGMVCPRSGLAIRHGVTVLNAPGIVDSDFRGEVCVLLANLGDEAYHVRPGDRIAQMVITTTPFSAPGMSALSESSTLDETLRGGSGFGSTGR